MILQIYTIIHTLISLVAIFTGFVVVLGLLGGKRLDGWTKWFLITAVATTITGFFFPFHGFTPAIGLGIISLPFLALTIFARYPKHLSGLWRWIYVIGAVICLYFNLFVAVVQAFEKIPALHAMAPTRTEPPFTHAACRPPGFHSAGNRCHDPISSRAAHHHQLKDKINIVV